MISNNCGEIKIISNEYWVDDEDVDDNDINVDNT